MESDREAVIAFLEEEDNQCRCGHPRDEAWDEANEHRYRGAAFDCHACAARERREDEDRKAAEGAEFYGRTWVALDRAGDD